MIMMKTYSNLNKTEARIVTLGKPNIIFLTPGVQEI